MKRKMMSVGFAMLAGFPGALLAKSSGEGGTVGVQSYQLWGGNYSPHYGEMGKAQPLMDHLSPPVLRDRASKAWVLEMAPPAAGDGESEGPLIVRDKPMGFTLKLSF